MNKPTHGGKRPNAGRKKLFLEPMMQVLIPRSLKRAFYEWRKKVGGR